MDLAALEVKARSAQSRAALEQLLNDARALRDVVAQKLLYEVLQERFPVAPKSGGKGPSPTVATFLGHTETFPTGKDAYIWLVEKLRTDKPSLLTAFNRIRQRVTRAKGRRFAQSVAELLPPQSRRKLSNADFEPLSGDWFAYVAMDHDSKFLTLLALSELAGYRFGTDWYFEPTGSTEELRLHQESELRAQEALAKWALRDAP